LNLLNLKFKTIEKIDITDIDSVIHFYEIHLKNKYAFDANMCYLWNEPKFRRCVTKQGIDKNAVKDEDNDELISLEVYFYQQLKDMDIEFRKYYNIKGNKGLRAKAKDYKISYETIRTALEKKVKESISVAVYSVKPNTPFLLFDEFTEEQIKTTHKNHYAYPKENPIVLFSKRVMGETTLTNYMQIDIDYKDFVFDTSKQDMEDLLDISKKVLERIKFFKHITISSSNLGVKASLSINNTEMLHEITKDSPKYLNYKLLNSKIWTTINKTISAILQAKIFESVEFQNRFPKGSYVFNREVNSYIKTKKEIEEGLYNCTDISNVENTYVGSSSTETCMITSDPLSQAQICFLPIHEYQYFNEKATQLILTSDKSKPCNCYMNHKQSIIKLVHLVKQEQKMTEKEKL
jgi:hypothetical protein